MNPMDLLKNFGNIQEKLKESQERLKALEATGHAGGDMVQVVMSGDLEVKSVKISPEAVDPEDIEMLQDLIVAAYADALFHVRQLINDQMSDLTGGMPIPPGMFGK